MENVGRVQPRWAAVGAAVCGVVVLVVATMASSYRTAPSMATLAVLDTLAATSALLAAFLVFSRFRYSGLARDALMSFALLLLASGNLAFSVVPVAAGHQATTSGAPVLTGMLSAGCFMLATYLPGGVLHRPLVTLWVGLAVTATVLLAAGVLGERLPGRPGGGGSADAFGASPSVLYSADQGLAALLYVIAAVGCLRLAEREGDQLMGAFAFAAVLAAVSRAAFALADSPSAAWAGAGHLFRVEFYVVLVAGAASEIALHFRRSAQTAVLEERRRIARELHDGLAQELAFIAGQSAYLAGLESAGRREAMLLGAAERALDESRRAIAALTRPLDEPFDVALAQTTEEVAGRLGMRVLFEMEGNAEASADTREALLRITREAITNAGRHGQASRVTVQLVNGNGLTLRITDNGRGFDDGDLARRGGGVGLSSIRERAEALGGRVDVRSRPYGGTAVEVWVP